MRLGRTFTVIALAAAIACVAGPAAAQSKQTMVDEMTAVFNQMQGLRGNPSAGPQLTQLQARYDELRTALGGVHPAPRLAARTGGAGGDQAPLGAPPVPVGCTPTTTPFPSTDTPIAISASGTPTITSTLAVSGVDTYLWDVDVDTTITHTWNSDLQIALTSPSGTTVTLTSNNAGSTDNVYNGTAWDDDADPDGVPPYITNNGLATDHAYVNLVTATPLAVEEALGAFIGEDPNGNWVMTISDQANLDGGSLATWTLTLVTIPVPPIVVSSAFPSTDTPIAISPTGTPTITSTLAVSGADTFLSDVDVDTTITHTWNSDLQIALTSPAGTTVTLTSNNAGSTDNVYNGTAWDDDANPGGVPPYITNNGLASDHAYVNLVTATPLVPEEAFAAFIGEDPNGNWVMTIADQANLDGGSLATWTLNLETATCVLPDTDLQVTKTGSAAGSQITWTITVTNNGPDGATGVVVTDPLDPCTTFVSDDCGGVNVPPWTWNVGNLANGASATCNVLVDASACPVGPVSNTATAAGNENDPTPGNNVATAGVQVGSVLEIPTLGRAGLVLLLLAITLGALVILRRRG